MAQPKHRLGPAYRVVAGIVRPLLLLLTRRDWRGSGNLPAEGIGCVVVANHISHVDFLTSAHFLWDHGRAPRFLAKESLFRIPVVGRIIASCGQIPVYRDTKDAAKAYRAAVKAVESGECVLIYPEGTITKQPELWPMTGRTGAARVALETGCDVIPIAQWGPQDILAPYSKRVRLLPPKLVKISAGKPVDLDDLRRQAITKDVLTDATERIMGAVTTGLEGLRHQVAPAERFDPRAVAAPSSTEAPDLAQKTDDGDDKRGADA